MTAKKNTIKNGHDRLLRSNMGMGVLSPGSRIPPSNQSVNPTTFAPTPFSQFPPSCAVSIVCVSTLPSASKSKMNNPVKALLGSTPSLLSLRDRAMAAPAPPLLLLLSSAEQDLRCSHQRTTSCSGMAPARRGRNVRGSEVMRSARISRRTLPMMGTRFQAMGDVQRAALYATRPETVGR